MPTPSQQAVDKLDPLLIRILVMKANGAYYRQIGAELNYSTDYVKDKVRLLFRRYGVKQHHKMIYAAYAAGDLVPDEGYGLRVAGRPHHTKRRLEVIRSVVDTDELSEAATANLITTDTVKTHIRKFVREFGREGVVSRAYVVVLMWEYGYITRRVE